MTRRASSSRRLRRWRRGLAGWGIIRLAALAARGGPDRIRRVGHAIARLHDWLTRPMQGRLRSDIARALDISKRQAGRILSRAYADNDRAVFEIIAQADPACDIDALTAGVEILDLDRLGPPAPREQGAILLGMHMGNGILMASKLARLGYPVHVVFREPRRLPPGLLTRALERGGCFPVALDRQNPTRSFRRMLAILKAGGMIYVLMDQANKGEGPTKSFLGKPMPMPAGVPGLAIRTGVPVWPIHAEASSPRWQFRVHPRLEAETAEQLLDAIVASMARQVRCFPALWTWHHRRWRRYDFISDSNLREEASTCP